MKLEAKDKDLFKIDNIYPITTKEVPLAEKFVNGEPIFSDTAIKVYSVSETTNNDQE